ncbi:SIMPL domain-containing protein [Nitrincola sp. MINF-07-Sa-05]|uniref:SIMPL domain-containing protein n=1 Tax=Nitrincola salilacus TaxID=3400273 RepID=UPI003917C1FA
MKERQLLLVSLLGILFIFSAIILGPSLLGTHIRDGLTGSAGVITSADRKVTVRGLAEREVAANQVLWPLVFQVQAQDLGSLQEQIDQQREQVNAFLLLQGFTPEQIQPVPTQINDREQHVYGEQRPAFRYGADVVMLVRSDNASQVKLAMNSTDELVRAGISLAQSYEHMPRFLFTELESIKPEMVAEATRDARRAAEQFAEDSDSQVGAILQATQGLFSIEDLDNYTPEIKRVRVVTSVAFRLE